MRSELYKVGYTDDRKVDTTRFVELLREDNLVVVNSAVKFVEKYGGMCFWDNCEEVPTDIYNYKGCRYHFTKARKNISKEVVSKLMNNSGETVNFIGSMLFLTFQIDIFITESGSFYIDRGYKIADNEAAFWEYVFSLSASDLQNIIDSSIFDVLRKSGWYDGRKIDSIDYVNRLQRGGHTEIFKCAIDFYEEFGELKLIDANGENVYTTLSNLPDYIFETNKSKEFEMKFGEKLIPIGRGDYSIMFVSESGKVYLDSVGLCGNYFIEAWNTLLKKR
jgi:hypothetical protein